MTRPALITAAVVGLCAALLAGASTAGAATEYFASPDETRTTQDCGTRARACALGVAVRRPTSPDDTVVVLAGSYDLADINAGAAPGSEPGQLELVPGTTLSGDLDGPVPTISSAAASGAPTIALTRNTLRWLRWSVEVRREPRSPVRAGPRTRPSSTASSLCPPASSG